MNEATKRGVSYFILFILSGSLVFSAIPDIVGEYTFRLLELGLDALEVGDDYKVLKPAIGFLGQMAIASLLLFLPICLVGGAWFGRLSYQLFFGNLSDFAGMPGVVIKLLGVACLIMFFYSFYEQYRWLERLHQVRSMKNMDKELAKLI